MKCSICKKEATNFEKVDELNICIPCYILHITRYKARTGKKVNDIDDLRIIFKKKEKTTKKTSKIF